MFYFAISFIAAIALFVFYLWYPIAQTIKISDQLIAKTTPYEQHPLKPDKYILVIGDSSAVGVGAANNHDSIAGRLGQQFQNADITNLGVSGAKLKEALALLEQQQQKRYDLIVLQIGANDITHLTSLDTVRKELSSILAISVKMSPKTILLTSGNIGAAPLFRFPLSTYLTSRTLKVRSIFMEEASKYPSVNYIDLYREPNDDPFLNDLKKFYAPDSFHLSGDGYGIWYQEIQKKLAEAEKD